MAYIIQNTDLIGSGTQISAGFDDDVAVTEGTVVAATDTSPAIFGTGSNIVTIDGAVYGQSTTITLSGGNSRLTIGVSGYVGTGIDNLSSVAAVAVEGDSAQIINHGTVDGGSALTIRSGAYGTIMNTGRATGKNALVFDGMDSDAIGTVINSGYAFGASHGVMVFASQATQSYTVINTGIIGGNLVGVEVGQGADTVSNAGQVFGAVNLLGGDDIFDGRGGTVNGTVNGGTGNDMYYVDDETIQLVELTGEGSDEVRSTVSWKLGDNFENLELLGQQDTRGVGNGEINTIEGNSGNNLLRGRGGNDILIGGGGEDRLQGGAGGDTLNGGEDNDTLLGGGAKDRLYGDGGDDVLDGGSGFDRLWGGDGYDTFVFARTDHSTNDANADIIKDFVSGTDLIDLSALNAGDLTYLGNGSFTGSAAEARWVVNGNDVIMRVDADGDGSADMKVVLEGIASLTEADFIL